MSGATAPVVRPGLRLSPASALAAWARSLRPGNVWPIPAIAAGVAVLLLVESAIPPGTARLLSSVFMFVALAQSWNLIGGFTGYASFGQAAFYGLGAYTTAVLMSKYHQDFWPTLPLAAVAGALFAVVVGMPLLRLRGHYFAIATLGVAVGLQEVVNNLTGITGGGAGITIPVFKLPAPYPSDSDFYTYFLLAAAISIVIVLVVSRSRFGYAMRAINQDVDAAGALGVNTTAVKVAAFALSAAIAAAVGALSGFQTIQFYPEDVFDANITVLMVIMVVLGGSGSVAGPVAGAVALELLRQELRVVAPGYSFLVLGAIIVVAVVFFPQGLVPFFRDAWRERRLAPLDNIRRYRL